MKIKKFNEGLKQTKYYTIRDLKEIMKGLPDDTPVVLITPAANRGNNDIESNFAVDNVNLDTETGYAYYGGDRHRKDIKEVKALLIFGD